MSPIVFDFKRTTELLNENDIADVHPLCICLHETRYYAINFTIDLNESGVKKAQEILRSQGSKIADDVERICYFSLLAAEINHGFDVHPALCLECAKANGELDFTIEEAYINSAEVSMIVEVIFEIFDDLQDELLALLIDFVANGYELIDLRE